MSVEVGRIPDFGYGDFNCEGCGRKLHLYFNGGELDDKECCGYRYSTEHTQIDLVIYRVGE